MLLQASILPGETDKKLVKRLIDNVICKLWSLHKIEREKRDQECNLLSLHWVVAATVWPGANIYFSDLQAREELANTIGDLEHFLKI